LGTVPVVSPSPFPLWLSGAIWVTDKGSLVSELPAPSFPLEIVPPSCALTHTGVFLPFPSCCASCLIIFIKTTGRCPLVRFSTPPFLPDFQRSRIFWDTPRWGSSFPRSFPPTWRWRRTFVFNPLKSPCEMGTGTPCYFLPCSSNVASLPPLLGVR